MGWAGAWGGGGGGVGGGGRLGFGYLQKTRPTRSKPHSSGAV